MDDDSKHTSKITMWGVLWRLPRVLLRLLKELKLAAVRRYPSKPGSGNKRQIEKCVNLLRATFSCGLIAAITSPPSLVYNYYKGAFAACAKVVCMSGLCLGKHFYHRCLNTIDSFFVLYVTDGILSWKTLQNNS